MVKRLPALASQSTLSHAKRPLSAVPAAALAGLWEGAFEGIGTRFSR